MESIAATAYNEKDKVPSFGGKYPAMEAAAEELSAASPLASEGLGFTSQGKHVVGPLP